MEFKYVSSVKGRLVPRFSSLSGPATAYIGAKAECPPGSKRGKIVTWDTKRVVPIPLDEWNRYRREYLTAVRDGSLIEKTPKQFKAWANAQAKKAEAARKAAETNNDKASEEGAGEGDQQ